MAEFEATVSVETDPETTFEYISDFVNVAEWDPNVRVAKSLGEGDPAVGSSYAVTTGFYGKAVETICEIHQLDASSTLVVGIDGGKLTGTYRISVAPVDSGPPAGDGSASTDASGGTGSSGGSMVTVRIEVDLQGAARVLNRGLQLALSGMGENAVVGLRKRLAKQRA